MARLSPSPISRAINPRSRNKFRFIVVVFEPLYFWTAIPSWLGWGDYTQYLGKREIELPQAKALHLQVQSKMGLVITHIFYVHQFQGRKQNLSHEFREFSRIGFINSCELAKFAAKCSCLAASRNLWGITRNGRVAA